MLHWRVKGRSWRCYMPPEWTKCKRLRAPPRQLGRQGSQGRQGFWERPQKKGSNPKEGTNGAPPL